MSRFSDAERREIIAEARATVARQKSAPYRQQQFDIIYKDGPGLSSDADDGAASASASVRAPSGAAGALLWWQWVEQHCDYQAEVMQEVLGELFAQRDAEHRRELKLLRDEVGALRAEVKLKDSLHALHDEVEVARKRVPDFPAIAERLEGELAATKAKLGKARADQAMTDHRFAELRQELEATKRAAKAAIKTAVNATTVIELEMQRFVARNIHPDAAKALKEFAAEALKAQQRGRAAPTRPATEPRSYALADATVLENWPHGEIIVPS